MRLHAKEGLRYVLKRDGPEAREALDHWLAWAWHSNMPAFVDLASKVAAYREAIEAAIDSRLSNVLAESTNTKIRLFTRIAYGFMGQNPSSPWPCSPWVATHHPCQAGIDPHIEQERLFSEL